MILSSGGKGKKTEEKAKSKETKPKQEKPKPQEQPAEEAEKPKKVDHFKDWKKRYKKLSFLLMLSMVPKIEVFLSKFDLSF